MGIIYERRTVAGRTAALFESLMRPDLENGLLIVIKKPFLRGGIESIVKEAISRTFAADKSGTRQHS